MIPFETKGGQVSEDDMIMQLVEKLRESSELAYRIGHYNNGHHRSERGDGFKRFGENFERASKLVLGFANAAGRMQ